MLELSKSSSSFLVAIVRRVWLQIVILTIVLSGHLLLEFVPNASKHPTYSKAISLFAVWVGAWIVARIVAVFNESAAIQSRLAPNIRTLLFLFIKFVIYSLGFLVALDSIGVSITPLLASLGVGSLAVGLALQDTLGNLFSGFYLYLDRAIAIGDWIRIDGGVEGRVLKIGWRSTQLMVGENLVIIPNSKLSTTAVTNFSLPAVQSTVTIPLAVAYESNLEFVEQVVLDAARRVMHKQPSVYLEAEGFPQVRFQKFGESSVELTLAVRVRAFPDLVLARHELIKEVQATLGREKIAAPYPKRIVEQRAPSF